MGTPPTLQDFREELLKQNEPEAQEIALAIELFTDGSLNTFAKHTNVDTHSRLICYDILDLGKQLQPIGMLVVLDSILNRITMNRAKGRNTFIFIDEIYLLFQHEYSANFLFTLWKRVRKYGAVLYWNHAERRRPLAEPHGEDDACQQRVYHYVKPSVHRPYRACKAAEYLRPSDELYHERRGRTGITQSRQPPLCLFVNKFPRNTELYKLMTTKFGEC